MEVELVELVCGHGVDELQHLLLGEEVAGYVHHGSPVGEAGRIVDLHQGHSTADFPRREQLQQRLYTVEPSSPRGVGGDAYALLRDLQSIGFVG